MTPVCREVQPLSQVWPSGAQVRPVGGRVHPSALPCSPLRSQQDLFRVLKAYTLYRPEEGYCQAQAPIAAVLLMHMPAEVPLGHGRVGRQAAGEHPAARPHVSLAHSKPFGAWCRSVRSTCPAPTVRSW